MSPFGFDFGGFLGGVWDSTQEQIGDIFGSGRRGSGGGVPPGVAIPSAPPPSTGYTFDINAMIPILLVGVVIIFLVKK